MIDIVTLLLRLVVGANRASRLAGSASGAPGGSGGRFARSIDLRRSAIGYSGFAGTFVPTSVMLVLHGAWRPTLPVDEEVEAAVAWDRGNMEVAEGSVLLG
jgi:hypothetical protein